MCGTAPEAEALPNLAMVRPMIPTVFGDSFVRGRRRTQAVTDGHVAKRDKYSRLVSDLLRPPSGPP